jgi:BCD family chlorophyll transporter-like MFS transporter
MMMIAGFAVTAGVAGQLLDPYSPQRLLVGERRGVDRGGCC